jgi:hypothetical protein
MAVEFLADLFPQSLYGRFAVVVEQVEEGLEHVEMESGSDEFPVSPPFVSCADEETVAKPWLEEPVLGSLVNVDVAAQDQLDVVGMSQENEEPGSCPKLDHVFVLKAL